MSAKGSMQCRIIRSLEEIEAIAQDWRALEAQCADPMAYFQSYDWCRNWVARFCQDGAHSAYVISVWRDETLVAIWPRMIVEVLGIRRLETLGVPHAQYCGLLIRPDVSAKTEMRRMLDSAVRQSGCDLILCRAVLKGSALDQLVGGRQLKGPANAASMLDLSGFASPEDYVGQLGKLQKRNRNRRRNHLARLGELHFSVIWPDDAEFSTLLELCIAMKRRWLEETGKISTGFAMRGVDDFLGTLSGDHQSLSGACLSVLRAGDSVVAVELGFIHHNHYYAYLGGFDWELRQLSPGKVQMDMTVAWLIEQGIGRYDLLINPAEYKESWSNTQIVVSSRADALNWKGRLYASTWLQKVRPALKHVHDRLPETRDRLLSWLRPAACILLYV